MPELGPYGSVRGAAGNSRPYRERRPIEEVRRGAGAVVGKPSEKEPAGSGWRRCRGRYGDFGAVPGDVARC